MQKLLKKLKGKKHIVFLDFEGTQFSHEMIAIGAVACQINSDGTIKKSKKPFKIYVLAKNKIGAFVTNLTGLSDDFIHSNGVTFYTAMYSLKKYIGLHFNKSIFLTFGNHDLRILNQSISYNIDYPKEICHTIQTNYLDFANFINEFVRDDNGNPLSLTNACKLFNVIPDGINHDPSFDALNLMYLYDAFIKNKEILLQTFKKSINKSNHFPEPINEVIDRLVQGKDVTSQEFENLLKEYIK